MRSIIIILISLISFSVWAQKTSEEKKGDKLYNKYSFKAAIAKYEETETLTTEGKRNLADSYFKVGEYEQSEIIYSDLVGSKEGNPNDYYNYASVLRRNGKTNLSDTWMKKFCEKLPNDSRSKKYFDDLKKMEALSKDEGRYKISNLDINTDHQDFGPSYYVGKMVFTSTREDIKSVKRSYNWNGMPFLDMYVADMDKEQFVNPRQFSKSVNHNMHEGPASFTADGNFMAFTRNNYDAKSKDGTTQLQIFFAEKNTKGEWDNIYPFKMNNSEYSVAYPCLSQDGKVMYFCSDMPGGAGGADIYRIEKNRFGTWGEPVNLGKTINTEGNEVFPFFQEEKNTLFFSSNGHLGIGGLDLFMSLRNAAGQFNTVKNMGFPLNTRFDDFAMIMDENMKRGYFSSNREGGKGDDDIYFLEIKKPIVFEKTIMGITKDNKGYVLAGVKINIYDGKGNVIGTCTSSEKGEYKFNAEPNRELKLDIGVKNYFPYSATVSTKTEKDEITMDLTLERK